MLDDRNRYLATLCQRLMPQDTSLLDEVKLAAANPEAYATSFQNRLARRGIYVGDRKEHPHLPWIALIDGLEERGRLAEIDWKEDVEDVMRYLDRLLVDQPEDMDRWTWVNIDAWKEARTIEFLHAVSNHLINRGLLLAYLAYPSDSYPLVLIEPQQFSDLQALTERTGYGRLISLLETEDLT